MEITELPYWLQGLVIRGREGEENDDDNSGSEDDDNDDDDGDDDDNDDGASGGSGGSDDDHSDNAALKKALEEERKGRREERKLRRKAEREAREAKNAKDSSEEAKTLEDTQSKLQSERDKTTRLATRLLNNELERAVLEEARRQGYIDPTDALTSGVLKEIDYDQDTEDPSDIEVDTDSVKDAVASLANRKKHLVATPGDGAPSGSKMKKGNGQQSKKTTDDQLRDIYTSLR